MRAGDAMRRDEIRSLIAMLKAAQQIKLTQSLEQHGLILEDSPDAELSSEQLAEIERLRAASRLDPAEEQAVLVRSVVQHRQSIDAFKKGKRDDLLQVEEAQLAIDAGYVPQLDDAAIEGAIREAVRESGAQVLRDQGKVMTLLSARLRGRADMKAVAARVQALLGQSSNS
ncbi:MAG TPA: GatB/YqeY domain-containing protein [Chloroflexota bacterium]|nr:GatB/YqeY domain-containing protein [Chloroflexota bacterium]